MRRGCYSFHRRKLHRLTVESSVPAARRPCRDKAHPRETGQGKKRERGKLRNHADLFTLFTLFFFLLLLFFFNFIPSSLHFVRRCLDLFSGNTIHLCSRRETSFQARSLSMYSIEIWDTGRIVGLGKVNAIERGFNDSCQSVVKWWIIPRGREIFYTVELLPSINIDIQYFFCLLLPLHRHAIDQLLIINDIGIRLVKIHHVVS